MAAAWQEDLKALLAECRPSAPVGSAREAAAMAAACAEGREWELKLRYLPDHGPARVRRWLETAIGAPPLVCVRPYSVPRLCSPL